MNISIHNKNQFLGVQISPGDSLVYPLSLDSMQCFIAKENQFPLEHGLQLWANPCSHLAVHSSPDMKAHTYVWGIPVHPQLKSSQIPAWCTEQVLQGSYAALKELLGTFVVIIDEPAQNRIIFITDILGVRPIFIGIHEGRIVFGTSVWPLFKAGLSSGKIDYDAVASWICYKFNCTDRSIFSDLSRLPAGSITFCQKERIRSIPYAHFKPTCKIKPIDQVADDLHTIVASSVKRLLTNYSHISLGLSGGFDSRYLLALASSLTQCSLKCFNVAYSHEEGYVASQVARSLGIPLKTYPVGDSLWDMFHEVFHFTADGFPISKFISYNAIHDFGNIPTMNGFMGDSLMYGSKDKFEGKYETEWKGDLVDVLQEKHMIQGLDLLFPEKIARRIIERAKPPLEAIVNEAGPSKKVFIWADFFLRQRLYISNNFLQHTHITEALLPFYNWELLQYKMEHVPQLFSQQIYQKIFSRHFPSLMCIPHASDIKLPATTSAKLTRHAQQWALDLVRGKTTGELLSILPKRDVIQRSLAALFRMQRVEWAMLTYRRLYLLEKRIRDAGLAFDWGKI